MSTEEEKIVAALSKKGFTDMTSKFEGEHVCVKKKGFNIAEFYFSQYPACCGIVIVQDIMYRIADDGLTTLIEALKVFEEEAVKDPEDDGSIVYEGPYGTIMISIIDDKLVAELTNIGYKIINSLQNPKTENTIYTLVKNINE